MSDENMPAAEVTSEAQERDAAQYELAFHVLPTVAEGEVAAVFEAVKSIITNDGGVIFAEEFPQRFDLAYEVVKHMEGKNRAFTSAYFGWIRFSAPAAALARITNEIDHNKNLLRYLLIKLTRLEEAHPFFFHEALASEKMVTTVGESEVIPDFTTKVEGEEHVAHKEEGGEVDDEALEKALESKEV